MLLSVIKNFAILVCSFYIFVKLLQITLNNVTIFKFFMFSLLATPLIYLLRENAGPISIFIIVLYQRFFYGLFLKPG
jgi:hypothetical protein